MGPAPVVAIVDHGGFLIYFGRTDRIQVQFRSVEIAIEKIRSALNRRSRAAARRSLLSVALEGGVPVISGGRIISIGSGTARQGGRVAKAAARAIKQRRIRTSEA
ncbi:MAG: heme-binding protein [Alphaproteobacteria bacterium]|nr:heme-binding protein [Alphaproteobacteria bacterium]